MKKYRFLFFCFVLLPCFLSSMHLEKIIELNFPNFSKNYLAVEKMLFSPSGEVLLIALSNQWIDFRPSCSIHVFNIEKKEFSHKYLHKGKLSPDFTCFNDNCFFVRELCNERGKQKEYKYYVYDCKRGRKTALGGYRTSEKDLMFIDEFWNQVTIGERQNFGFKPVDLLARFCKIDDACRPPSLRGEVLFSKCFKRQCPRFSKILWGVPGRVVVLDAREKFFLWDIFAQKVSCFDQQNDCKTCDVWCYRLWLCKVSRKYMLIGNCCGAYRHVSVYDRETREMVESRRWQFGEPFYKPEVGLLLWDAYFDKTGNGVFFVEAGNSKEGIRCAKRISYLDIKTKKMKTVADVKLLGDDCDDVVFSDDGKMLATRHSRKKVVLWEVIYPWEIDRDEPERREYMSDGDYSGDQITLNVGNNWSQNVPKFLFRR